MHGPPVTRQEPPVPRADTFIPWHRRLETSVVLAVTLVAGVSLTAVLYAAGRVFESYSLQRSADDLLAAKAAFDRLILSRAKFAAAQTRLIAELPVFRAHMDPSSPAAGDTATISAMAEDYRRKLAADFCIVTDALGRWIGIPEGTRSLSGLQVTDAISTARGGQSAYDIVPFEQSLYLIVSEPAMFADEVLGTMTTGYKLDDHVATELSRVNHCDVNLVCAGDRLCASSLPSAPRADLTSLLLVNRPELGAAESAPTLHRIGRDLYVSGVYPLLPSRGSGELVLLKSWAPTQQALDRMQRWLVWVGVATLGVALAGSLIASRRLTRPLRMLAEAANGIAAGDWSRKVPVDKSTAEARMMATAFNDMTSTLSHWHREATNRSEQLQDAYERFRAVTESANDAIVSVDGEARIVFWNRRAQEVFGYSEQEAIGQRLSVMIVESDAEVRRYFSAESDQMAGRTIEIAGRRRDGSAVPLEVSLSTWKSGAAVFYTAVIRDITDRRQAEAALRLRDEQLRQAQKMEAVGRLAGGIAHDFNNLLTAIIGYTEFLLADVPASSRGDVEGIQKAGRSAAALTRQLLAFSRKQVLKYEIVDFNTVVANTEKLLRRLITESVELELDLQPGLPPVKTDPGQIEQILLNLAVNARDAMPAGGRLTIATTSEEICAGTVRSRVAVPTGPCVVLSVVDTGSGMSDEVLAHLFEPFFTTKEFGKGTGLGLATVYGIVQQSGGYIEVESGPGKGTRFRIGLPAMPHATAVRPPVPAAPAAAPRGSETVLLVEDNESVRELARAALARAGYHVLEASNGEEGLRRVADHAGAIELVITDVVMPVMGGRELAARLAAMWPDLKIIFTSGYIDDAIVQHEPLGRRSAFIQKPFTPDELGRIVRDILDDVRTPE
jgi:PAS domain S-box-containing protein